MVNPATAEKTIPFKKAPEVKPVVMVTFCTFTPWYHHKPWAE
jgi:hypothetical protein